MPKKKKIRDRYIINVSRTALHTYQTDLSVNNINLKISDSRKDFVYCDSVAKSTLHVHSKNTNNEHNGLGMVWLVMENDIVKQKFFGII